MIATSKSTTNEGFDPTLPYQSNHLLYIMHACFAFTARMWDMGIVLLLAALSDNNLALVAFSGFLTNLFVVLFMTSIGQFLDRTNRLTAVKYALGTKFTSMAVAYSICAYFSYLKLSGGHVPIHYLYVIPFASALANLSFSAVSTSVEKDWIVVLANKDSQWLSNTNSRMTQIDSCCNTVAPAVAGLLFVQFSPSVVAVILLLSNTLSTTFLYIFMHHLYNSWAALAERETKEAVTGTATGGEEENNTDTGSLLGSLSLEEQIEEKVLVVNEAGEGYFHDFFYRSGCAGTMIAYAFLYFTVLSYDSLMIVYLRWSHMSDAWIGAGRGVGALTGLLGASLFPIFTNWFGIYKPTNYAILFQFVLVVIACLSFFANGTRYAQYGVEILCVSVLLSRTGLWMFDLGVRQIAQETIPEYCRGKVNGQWKSLISFFEMTTYIIAGALSDPREFWLLAVVSTAMVGSALVVFTLTRPDLYQKTLDYELVKNPSNDLNTEKSNPGWSCV